LAKRHDFRYIGRIRVGENLAVKHTVDYIAEGAGGDERYRDDIAQGHTQRLDNTAQVAQQKRHKYNTESGEKEFAAKLDAERHAIVLDKA
jgi:hypothetical protein